MTMPWKSETHQVTALLLAKALLVDKCSRPWKGPLPLRWPAVLRVGRMTWAMRPGGTVTGHIEVKPRCP